MEGPPLGPGGEDITWPDQVAPRGRKASSTRKNKPQTSNFFGRVACHLLLLLFSFLVTVIFLLFFLFFRRVAVLCFCRWHILAGGHSAKSKQHTKCCTDRRAKRCTDRRTERRTDLVAVIVKYLSCTQNRLATLSNKNEHSTPLDAKTIRNHKFRVGSAQQLYHRWRLRICGTGSVCAGFGWQKPCKFIGDSHNDPPQGMDGTPIPYSYGHGLSFLESL